MHRSATQAVHKGEVANGPANRFDELLFDCPSGLGLRTYQKIECADVRDHQQRYVDDRYRVGGTQPLRVRRKADLDGVIIVDDEVDRPYEIEGDDEQPEKRAYPHREKRQHGQHSGREVAIGSEGGEAGRQVGTYNTRKDEDEPEEAEAVQSSDSALRCDPVHRLKP